ncbi:MAG: RNA-binding transcriptional accessory protein [Bdellovibrionaceae bacterium]|nr:RNA-binding transcriptional accessory protein [Pseudobdellovibrionaceae bacterium]
MVKSLESYLKDKLPAIPWKSAKAILELKAEGGTIPFIARYRKERTGNMDEVQIREVIDSEVEYNEVLARKEFVLKEIGEQGNLTDELKKRIESTWTLAEVEELYRPYKKKKKTKATLAREAGIEPLAEWIWSLGHGGDNAGVTLEVKAKEFLNVEKQFATYEEVLRGATNILIEKISNNPELRQAVRDEFTDNGKVGSKPGKKIKANSKFEMYFDYNEPVKSLKLKKNSHRYLAMRRGWTEEELAVTITADEDMLLAKFQNFAAPKPNPVAKNFLDLAAKSALTIHVVPSITNEIHRELKDEADIHAIEVFASNVKKVLLASPFGPRCVLGVDPGIRTGCKIALVDKQGHFISHTVLHIQGEGAEDKAKALFQEVLKQIQIEAIAVGNGTGGREAEVFLRKIIKELGKEIPVILISESGASIYSASDVARNEFPDLDLTVRGAISIARRLQDPLAELVKIEPKSIGVGQYQHDVSQPTLKKKLDEVVESCVNNVGVDVNTASENLLQYVAGIGPATAKNIVAFRKEKGLFKRRDDLNKVPNFSSKVFEQSAGFLRVRGGEVALDATGVHPERYAAVKDIASEIGSNVSELMGKGAESILKVKDKWVNLIGEFTFNDIYEELKKPGRDPRAEYQPFQFRDDIFELKDVKEGMICNGIVTNVTNFGAFVDIGVHQDGLVHISELSNQFVNDAQKVVSPGDHVTVKVRGVDLEKNQISLTMKMSDNPEARPARRESTENRERGPRREARSGGEQRGPRQDRPQGDKQARGGGKPHHGGGKPSQEGGKPSGDRDRKPKGQPFNNPFAALQDINKR